MFCKHCGKEIADDAKFCDGCGKPIASAETETPKKKKKKRHPILGTIVLIFGIFMVIGAVGGGSDTPEKVSSNASTVAEVPVETAPELFTVGDTLEMDNVLVTLVDVQEIAGSQFLNPSDGNVYVLCEFTIENKTESELSVSSMMSFEAYFDDFAANLSISALSSAQGKQQLDGTVAAGKKINGIVGYEVPKEWSTMEVRFSPNAFASKAFVFNYSK